MSAQDRSARATRVLRITMLVVIALVALANGAGWVDADLWIPFVCIIAVMGIGTRGGPVDALSFVLIEASVVVVLGVATFGGSRDGVWAASVAVSVLAIGKIAMVELHRRDEARGKELDQRGNADAVESRGPQRMDDVAPESSALASPEEKAAENIAEDIAAGAPRGPRAVSEAPPAPMSPAPARSPAAPPSSETSTSDSSAPRTRKRRDRNDPTPKSVPISRPR